MKAVIILVMFTAVKTAPTFGKVGPSTALRTGLRRLNEDHEGGLRILSCDFGRQRNTAEISTSVWEKTSTPKRVQEERLIVLSLLKINC